MDPVEQNKDYPVPTDELQERMLGLADWVCAQPIVADGLAVSLDQFSLADFRAIWEHVKAGRLRYSLNDDATLGESSIELVAGEGLATWRVKQYDQSLSPNELRVLRVLAEAPSLTKLQVEIEAASLVSRRSIGPILDSLENRHLIERPGERKGAAISAKGLELVRRLEDVKLG